MLTNDLRRDFTFVHPELFLDRKYTLEEGVVSLNNTENPQKYATMILPGCNIISYRTLEKLKAFYDQGGAIISTTRLPFKSAERGEDQRVIKLIKDIFGIDPLEQYNITVVSENVNLKGGTATFIPQPDEASMHEALSNHAPPADVQFIPNPRLKTDFVKFSYIHKVKEDRHIYYFANSSDESISCKLVFKGKLKLGQWDPHTGEIIKHIPKKPIQ